MELDITGAKIFFTIFGIPITETIVNTWLVMGIITILCLVLTKDLKRTPDTKRQQIAESIVVWFDTLVQSNMGSGYKEFVPFIAALFSLSALSSLSSLFGLYAPTADLSTTLGWALMVFVMITYTKIKTNGIKGYLKGFTEPVFILTPFNILGEVSTPMSMAFRHFGNIASGAVVSGLIYGALSVLSHSLLRWLPLGLGEIPLFQIGLPALLSIYFDLFTSILQAYIFCMLTMIYIASAGEKEA